MKKTILFLLIISMLVSLPASAATPTAKPGEVTVRVCILDGKESVFISLKNDYAIYPVNSDKAVIEGSCLSAKVVATKGGLAIGRYDIPGSGVRIRVGKDSKIYVGGKRFRGSIDIMRKDDGTLMVINHIELDDYLYGVLYHEVSHRWPIEVLKAQAITARTFALYQARQNRLQPYDLRSDIYSQVYGGSGSEKWSTNMAVNLTKGKVLTYKGDIFPAYYHATCAGYTEDASNLWKIDIPPLDGSPCDTCGLSPHYTWIKELPLWKLEEKLRENGYTIGRIETIAVLSRNSSGRVDKLEIKDNAGVSIVLTGKDFRNILGPNELRSTRFDATVKLGSCVLQGSGWGHGVGMCQWGAFGMANNGKTVEEILGRYYPGASITSMDKIRDKL